MFLSTVLLTASACAGTDPVPRDDDDDGGGNPLPPSLVMVRPTKDGSGQEGVAGEFLIQAFLVRIVDQNTGNPVPGIPVDWRPVTQGGVMVPATSQSDAFGYASSFYKANTIAGVQRAEAVLDEQVEVYSVIVKAGPPSEMFVRHSGDSVRVDEYSQMFVEVIDAYGNGVEDVPVVWTLVGGPVADWAAMDFTVSGGDAFSTVFFGPVPTTVDLTASLPTVPAIPSQTVRFTSY